MKKQTTNSNKYPQAAEVLLALPAKIRKWYSSLPAPATDEEIETMKIIIKLNRKYKDLPVVTTQL